MNILSGGLGQFDDALLVVAAGSEVVALEIQRVQAVVLLESVASGTAVL